MSFDLIALKDQAAGLPRTTSRQSVDVATQTLARLLPIRWRLFSIAALNAMVAVILAVLILERRQHSQQCLGGRKEGARIRQASGPIAERGESPAKPDPSLYQST